MAINLTYPMLYMEFIVYYAAMSSTKSLVKPMKETPSKNDVSASSDSDKAFSGAELLVQTLEENGVEYIFGVPGDIENEFFGVLKDSTITFFNTRIEQTGAMMADVYYRLTGKIGVCFSTLGPGATNMITGVANAHQDRSAILALSGQLAAEKHFEDSHQYIDLIKMYSPVTKESIMIDRARDIDADINKAIKMALQEKPGPVHVTVPINVLKEDARHYRTIDRHDEVSYNYADDLEKLYNKIAESDSIIAIVGNGVVRARAVEELKKFLEEYEIPAFASFMGKGVLPENHRLSLGVLSRHSQKARDVLGKHQVVITIGYDPIEGVEPDIWKGAGFVAHIDSSIPSARSIYKPDLEIIGDNKDILNDLVTKFSPVKKNHASLADMKIVSETPESVEHDFPIDPRYITKTLRRLLAGSDIVVSDVGYHKQYVGLHYPTYQPNTTVFSNGLSSMGFGLPGAMAAKLVLPNKKVVVICGDGGFQMNIQELATIVENQLNIVVIIMNDNSLGMVKKKQLEVVGHHYAADFMSSPNFSEIAKSYGCEGHKISSAEELESVLSDALQSERCTVIDVPIKQYTDIKAMK